MSDLNSIQGRRLHLQESEEAAQSQLSAAIAARDVLEVANDRLRKELAAREEQLEHLDAAFEQHHRCCNTEN